MLGGKRIIVGITGGIAAYKTAHLVRLLKRNGAEVRVLLTPTAREFVTPLTLATLSQNPILTEFFNPSDGQWNSHVSLGLWADLLVIAPATANTMAKMATGVCDNLLLTTYLSARCPTIVAPAMDLDMYQHPATQHNISQLLRDGVRTIEPDSGFLASGLEGKGRMAEPEAILAVIQQALAPTQKPLAGRNVLLTSGPTREHIDPVRYISNSSSGRMGTALAEALVAAGATVHCITGPAQYIPSPSSQVHVTQVTTAREMADAALALWPKMDAGIMAAAVADYTPSSPATAKIKRTGSTLQISLEACPDIAASLGATKGPQQRLIGFALETHDGPANALAKLQRKRLDLCVLNTPVPHVSGFDSSTNQATLIFADGHAEPRPVEEKSTLAQHIVDQLAQLLTVAGQ